MLKLRIGVALLAGTVALVLAMRSVGAQTEAVTYHDLSAMPSTPLGKMQVKAVITEWGSLAIAEVGPGTQQASHYHQQEQVSLGLGGSMEVSIGGMAHRLGVYGAAIPPSNTEHYFTNSDAGVGKFLEFQPVSRPDWLPPYPKVTPSKSPEPATVSSDQRVSTDLALSSDGWHVDANGARSKTLSGQTIRVTFWDLSSAKASADLTPQVARPERFVCVLEGRAAIAVGSSRRDIGPETIVVTSAAAKNIRLTSLDKGRTVVAVFESGIR